MTTSALEYAGRSLDELMAYAHAMELAAAARYRQLADMMDTHNNSELADLFRRFVDIELAHAQEVETLGVDLGAPVSRSERHAGSGLDGIEVMSFEEMHYLFRPYHALRIAYDFEERAAQFYAGLAESATRSDVRAAAQQLCSAERAHMRELEKWLSKYPAPEPGWDDDPDEPNEME